jgi:hypothetical protein
MSIVADYRDEPKAVAGETALRPDLDSYDIQFLITWLRAESNSDAGRQLDISLVAVKTQVNRIREKYAAVHRPAPTRASLLARALQDSLIRICDL